MRRHASPSVGFGLAFFCAIAADFRELFRRAAMQQSCNKPSLRRFDNVTEPLLSGFNQPVQKQDVDSRAGGRN
jgi:hypothetical protein